MSYEQYLQHLERVAVYHQNDVLQPMPEFDFNFIAERADRQTYSFLMTSPYAFTILLYEGHFKAISTALELERFIRGI